VEPSNHVEVAQVSDRRHSVTASLDKFDVHSSLSLVHFDLLNVSSKLSGVSIGS
jgi:hypothetical protein